MIKVKVIHYIHKTLSNGEHPIMIRISKGSLKKYISLGISCKKSDWNLNNDLLAKSHPLKRELDFLIQQRLYDVNKVILESSLADSKVTLESVLQEIKGIKKEKITLTGYCDQLIESYLKKEKYESARIFKSVKNVWVKFFNKNEIEFEEINLKKIEDFESYCKDKGNKPNTIFLYLRTLNTIINKAIRDRYAPSEFAPFKQFDMAKYRKNKTVKRAISRDEIKLIEELTLNSNSRMFHSRNYFLFSFYTGGMNFIDMALLKWDNISNTGISYLRKKTSGQINVPIIGSTRKILELYKEKFPPDKSNYVFPILSQNHKSELAINNRINKVNHQVNSDLREIGQCLNIKTKLTTYVARHSFATVMKFNGVSISVISQALGHESEKTTQIYLDNFANDVLEKAFEVL